MMELAQSAPVQLLGQAIRLADPGALWLLLAVLAAAVLGGVALARRRADLLRAAGPLAARIAPGAGVARPAARLGLTTLGLALLAVALARPQCGARTEVTRRAGVDVAIVLDASRSMQARDVRPDRLSRAKLEVGALLDQLGGDRVALVVFAGEAFVQCPLTTDTAAARLFLRAVGPDAIPQQGTGLSSALRAAEQVLDAAEKGAARSRAVLLVSDGEDHQGGAEDAAAALAAAGIRVHALAIGTPAGAPIPVLDASGNVARHLADRGGEPVLTRLDEAGLAALAARGNGRLFRLDLPAGHPDGLDGFRAELDRMERSELEGRTVVVYEDRYAWAALPALLCLLGALVLRERARAPEAQP